MNKVAETLSVIVSPVEKLIEAISGAIGTVWEPHKIKKMTDAEAYRIKVIGQAVSENGDLPIQYDKDGLSIDTTDYDGLKKRALYRFVRQETQKQYNLESIAEEAYDLLKDAVLETNDTVSDDWMNRFISFAQEVSDEDIRKIWAKILAGEIKKPNSFSLRTLSLLRNLSKEEALIFGKCCSLMINDYIPNDIDLLVKYGLNYYDILKMDDCGLINSDGMISKCIKLNSNGQPVFYNNELMIFCKSETNKELHLQEFPVTAAGKELCTITDQKINNNFIFDYAKLIESNNKDILVSVHKVNFIDGDNINYEERNLLEEWVG